MPYRELRQRRACECADPGCPVCHGAHGAGTQDGEHARVFAKATVRLYRVDMDDISGTDFCPECADDANKAGVYS